MEGRRWSGSFATFAEEVAFLKQHIGDQVARALPGICLRRRANEARCGRLRFPVEGCRFDTYEIKRNAAEQRDKPGLRVATMHRVKGLEFEHVIVVAANEGILPLDAVINDAADGVARRDAETGERSLIYVALTRARRSACITGYGEFTPFVRTP